MRRETCKFWDLVCFISDILRLMKSLPKHNETRQSANRVDDCPENISRELLYIPLYTFFIFFISNIFIQGITNQLQTVLPCRCFILLQYVLSWAVKYISMISAHGHTNDFFYSCTCKAQNKLLWLFMNQYWCEVFSLRAHNVKTKSHPVSFSPSQQGTV